MLWWVAGCVAVRLLAVGVALYVERGRVSRLRETWEAEVRRRQPVETVWRGGPWDNGPNRRV